MADKRWILPNGAIGIPVDAEGEASLREAGGRPVRKGELEGDEPNSDQPAEEQVTPKAPKEPKAPKAPKE